MVRFSFYNNHVVSPTEMLGAYCSTLWQHDTIRWSSRQDARSRPLFDVWHAIVRHIIIYDSVDTHYQLDGTSDPLDATIKAYNLITHLDGGDGEGTILSLSFSTAKITASRMCALLFSHADTLIRSHPKQLHQWILFCIRYSVYCGLWWLWASTWLLSPRLGSEFRYRLFCFFPWILQSDFS
jgi:hypothetical protein